MAITPDNAKAILEHGSLSDEEEKIVDSIEKYIDDEIIRQIDTDATIVIDLDVAEFRFHPRKDETIHLKEARRKKMINELEKRYDKAGWKITREFGEDDGPNRPGRDTWILKSKQ